VTSLSKKLKRKLRPKKPRKPEVPIKASKRSIGSLKAHKMMTSNVKSIFVDETLMKAIKCLTNNHISGAPLLDGKGHVIGVISQYDLMQMAAKGGVKAKISDFTDYLEKKPDLIYVGRETSFTEVFKLFMQYRVQRIIVVDNFKKLQGIITRTDIVSEFLKEEKEMAAFLSFNLNSKKSA
jgi:predicted transcriptional regulator